MLLDESLRAGVAYLRQVQRSDGGFIGWASPDPLDFSAARRHPTIFVTALILAALHEVDGTTTARRRAAAFLLHHKSSQWSWNYWMRNAEGARMPAYPDDLDDTACALVALSRYDPGLIDGAVLAQVAGQLVATEEAPGGPYRTWLVDADAPPAWRDTDIAVNANIGRFLQLQRVELPGLERYVAAAIKHSHLSSLYYVGSAPIRYFLSEWYHGPGVDRLRETVRRELDAAPPATTVLTQALLVTTAIRLGIGRKHLEASVQQLLAGQINGGWPAAAMYAEAAIHGVMHYAGSPALTSALCLEALTAYRNLPAEAAVVHPAPRITTQLPAAATRLLRQSAGIPHAELRRRFRLWIRRVAVRDRDQQITGMADIVAKACQQSLPATTLLALNAGSLAGWVAYTIYDDFLDGEGVPELLGVANLALRHTVASFQEALPDNSTFQQLVAGALARGDGANTWEALHARAVVMGTHLRLKRLPQYGDLSQLAERSWGHTLAATGVLMALGAAADSAEVIQLQRFFHHFLIARQLNDDAHDWEDDLRRGQITAVIALLLRAEGRGVIRLNLDRDLPKLRQRFWEEAIEEAAGLIQVHAAKARQALTDCAILMDTAAFEQWLDKLERSAKEAIDGRNQATKFITAYNTLN